MEGLTNDPGYYRDKVRENREGWALADIRSTSLFVPAKYREYFTSLSLMLQGLELLEILENDPSHHVLNVFANRRPKHSVTIQMIDDLRDKYHEKPDVVKECDRIEAFMRQARNDHTAGEVALTEGDAKRGFYHFMREYAQVKYVNGAYAMLLYLIGGGVVPDVNIVATQGTQADGI